MRTPKQIAASRANGAFSQGPVSIHGKLNSSRNSLRHGLLARTVVLEEESTDRFLELLHALIEEFHPTSGTPEVHAALAFKATSDSIQPDLILRALLPNLPRRPHLARHSRQRHYGTNPRTR